jgi:hypothetical protein
MKYKLTKNSKEVNGVTLYQIQALKNFEDVEKGDLGGWIEKEDNLSQKGNCWVYGNAKVFGNARVFDSARVFDNARVYGDALVFGSAKVYEYVWVYGNTQVFKDIKETENNVSDELDALSEDIEEVVIKGVRYKKVTETKTTWEKIS